jgi:alpha-tubulin suppressor-like RCC1 family protein
VLPDGRLWAECLHDAQRSAFHDLPFGQKWTGLNDNKFAPGSNWVDGVANAHETVGIRADGTLWVSARPRRFRDGNGPPVVEPAAGLVQFGTDTNWLSAAPHPDSAMFLLKRDGTLWDWGDDSLNGNQTQPGLRGFQPQRLGHDSDWARLLGSKGWIYACAWKTDGSGWILHDSKALRGIMDIKRQDLPSGISLTRLPALDGSRWRSLVTSDNFAFAGVRDDGTLWYWNYFQGSERPWRKLSTKTVPTDRWKPVQVGKASDLAELAGTWQRMVARKTDGSLWAWEVDGIWFWEPIEALKWAPVRLSTHSDWTALGVVGPDILSLAADGNLWSWPNTSPVGIFGEDSELQLAASRKPSKIENIFDPK